MQVDDDEEDCVLVAFNYRDFLGDMRGISHQFYPAWLDRHLVRVDRRIVGNNIQLSDGTEGGYSWWRYIQGRIAREVLHCVLPCRCDVCWPGTLERVRLYGPNRAVCCSVMLGQRASY